MSASAAYLRDAGFISSVHPCAYGFQSPGPVAELIRALMLRSACANPLIRSRDTVLGAHTRRGRPSEKPLISGCDTVLGTHGLRRGCRGG
jgi:hypothetical protein